MKSCKVRKARNSNQSHLRTHLTNSRPQTQSRSAQVHSINQGSKAFNPKRGNPPLQTGFASLVYAISGDVFPYKKTTHFHSWDIPKHRDSLISGHSKSSLSLPNNSSPDSSHIRSICFLFWIRVNLGERTSKQITQIY